MGDHQVARVGESNVDSRRSNFTHDLKRFGLFAAPIIAGLSMAGIAYQLVALIAVHLNMSLAQKCHAEPAAAAKHLG